MATVSRGTAGRGDPEVLARLAALEALTQHLVVVQGPVNGLAGPHLIFEGVNVHIRSGSGSTDDGTLVNPEAARTGLGNLIVGYNEPPEVIAPGDRSGSHTLLVGYKHLYSGVAGVVMGDENVVTGNFASVTAGTGNLATGDWSSVSGGASNFASGPSSSVSGGDGNQASGPGASVSGGRSHTASGVEASVSGGFQRIADIDRCWRAGALNQDCTP